MKRGPLPGAHTSAAGGTDKAVARIMALEGCALQVFTSNQRQWKGRELPEHEVRAFAELRREWGGYPAFAHGSYLLNPAAGESGPDRLLAERTVAALAGELERAGRLGLDGVVIHPGAHKGAGARRGCRLAARRLDTALESASRSRVPIVLETTAGSGTSLGGRLEELAAIIEASRHQDRLGICLDTAHVFAAGWDVRTARGLDKLLERVQNLLGLRRLALVHANDSKTPLGSGVDRHEHIGRGEIGLEGFAALVNHPALDGVPLILETPKQDDPADDARNLGILRSLLVR